MFKRYRRYGARAGLLLGLVVLCLTASQAARAGQACVVCTAPAATYLCRANAAPEHQSFLDNGRLIRFACIKNIAKTYRHGSCKASGHTAQSCVGPVVTVDLSDMARRYVDRLRQAGRPWPQATVRPPHGQPAPDAGEPKTVVEFAKRTMKTSQDQVEKAGEAVQGAGQAVTDSAQKTWDCLTTLFQRC